MKSDKRLILLVFIMVLLPLRGMVYGNELLQQRSAHFEKYWSLKDTMTIRTWKNMKEMTDNLEAIVLLDERIIDSLRRKSVQDSALISEHEFLTKRYQTVETERDILKSRTQNDMQMMLYLKAAVGLLLCALVVLIYILISRYNPGLKARKEAGHYAALFESKRQETELLIEELQSIRQREIGLREELENGMQLYQDKMQILMEKCRVIEEENSRLEQELTGDRIVGTTSLETINEGAVAESALKQKIESLAGERDTLLKLNEELSRNLEEEKEKRTQLIERIKAAAGNVKRQG
ncbi:MAG TPA: hypothetical protein PLV51_00775 [Lentimicrobium sp.]|nr:hypothetical protein [Lentimicrobium sp.]